MKKLIFSSLLLGIILSFIGCGSSTSSTIEDCQEQTNAITESSKKFSQNLSKSTCEEYVKSMKEFQNSDCYKNTFGTDKQKDAMKETMADVDCSQYK
ncbi:MAG: hypothetical protein ACRCVT_03335 [Leadbetterella sp.]